MSVLSADLAAWTEPGFDVVHVFHAAAAPVDVALTWVTQYLLQY